MKLVLMYTAVLAGPLISGVGLARGAIALATGEPPAARAAQNGGVSLTPSIVERRARVGATSTVTVANTTTRPVRVTLRRHPAGGSLYSALDFTGIPNLPLRNTGTTVEPITGHVALTGPRGTRANSLRPVRIVPRRLVRLTLGHLSRTAPRATGGPLPARRHADPRRPRGAPHDARRAACRVEATRRPVTGTALNAGTRACAGR